MYGRIVVDGASGGGARVVVDYECAMSRHISMSTLDDGDVLEM